MAVLAGAVTTEASAAPACSPEEGRKAIVHEAKLPAVLRRAAASTLVVPNPVMVICRDVTRDRRPDMVTAVAVGVSTVAGWQAWKRHDDHWELVGVGATGGPIVRAGGRIIGAVGAVYADNDPRCCPSGGWRWREWRWNGRHFVVTRTYVARSP